MLLQVLRPAAYSSAQLGLWRSTACRPRHDHIPGSAARRLRRVRLPGNESYLFFLDIAARPACYGWLPVQDNEPWGTEIVEESVAHSLTSNSEPPVRPQLPIMTGIGNSVAPGFRKIQDDARFAPFCRATAGKLSRAPEIPAVISGTLLSSTMSLDMLICAEVTNFAEAGITSTRNWT